MANKRQQRKPGAPSGEVLREIPLACRDETTAVEFLEKQRWGRKPVCPRCGSENVYRMTKAGTAERSPRFLWRCHDCKGQYTVRVGTVFEDSRIPLRHWCYAFWAACASKKGVSALQISRVCNLSYRSALFLMHRIRWAMAEPNGGEKLSGTVEVDETYVGGKPRVETRPNPRGRGTRKTPVMALVQRSGDVRAMVLPNVSAKTLRTNIENEVHRSSRLMTDDFVAYRRLGSEWPGGHEVVRHAWGQYVNGNACTNTAESFFALLKRGIFGTFHAVSKKHLHRYVSEFAFRWNTRKLDDGQRLAVALHAADGRRLMYREPVGNVS